MPEIGIADKVTLDAVNTKIDTNVGAKTDAASATGSLHAKVKDVKSAVSTIAGKDIVNYGSAIKSIQRGLYTGASETNISISISTVNPDKCVVLLTPVMFALGEGDANSISYVYLPTLVSISQNVIVVTSSRSSFPSGGGHSGQIQWQVIEFY